MALIGYARVSTSEQNPEAQTDVLTAAGCERIFTDKASGKLAQRPELDKALEYLRDGDILVITKLDRLGRSVRNLIELAADLEQRGVGLRVLHQGIDTTTPGGRLFFHIVASIAEFERDLISERTRDGLDAARARGRKGGRRAVLTDTKLAVARQMYGEKGDDGKRRYTVQEIADTVGCSRATLYRALGTGGAD
jgi:DNA invertase Pin-like site-specific DNA recombinase